MVDHFMIPVLRRVLGCMLRHHELAFALVVNCTNTTCKMVPRSETCATTFLNLFKSGQIVRGGHACGQVEVLKFSESR